MTGTPRGASSSFPSPSSVGTGASTPAAPTAAPGTIKNLIMHRILHVPIDRAEETRLRQQHNITDQDLETYMASLPVHGSTATPVSSSTAAPVATAESPLSSSSFPQSPPSRGRGRRPRGRRGPGPTNRRNQEGMR